MLSFACGVAPTSWGYQESSAPPATADLIDFQREVWPILVDHCLDCHGADHPESGFQLVSRDRALHSGDQHAPNILPGQAGESNLIRFAGGLVPEMQMPPDGDPLSADQLQILQRWIDLGAEWPQPPESSTSSTPGWWSFQPLTIPPVPEVTALGARSPDPPAGRNEIDAFIQAKLTGQQIAPSPPADRRTLIRRLYFDLVGLPPTPDELDDFLANDAPDAYTQLVDRLLASPRYGERWARFWMDAVHFAETHGHDQDRIREHAWPYRDYLIAAFNDDKPYAQFVQEQVAGDALFPDDPQATVALGFLAAGPWDESSLRDIREDTLDRQIGRYLDRDDMIANVMNNFTSLTVQCARCHDHKFDPIPQRDYFALQAVFSGVERANRWYDADPQRFRVRRELLAEQRRLRQAYDGANSGERAQAMRVIVPLAWSPAQPLAVVGFVRLGGVAKRLAALPPPSYVYAAASEFEPDGGLKPPPGPRPIQLLRRGDIRQPLEEVPPGTLTCVPQLAGHYTVEDLGNEAERRAALARWLTAPENPLLWRSIVNRIWQRHFGRGLVGSLNDFGQMGEQPTHPELLDWLATWFRDHGQSFKQLHRRIVTSATYCQSSEGRAADDPAYERDPENRLLWRMERTRLDAESIRDALLANSGRLDLSMGGPSDRQFDLQPGSHVTPLVDYSKFDLHNPAAFRRGVYRFLFRTLPDPWMESLDCPAGDLLTPARENSVTVQQALALWNNAWSVQLCEWMAERLQRSAEQTPAQVRLAFRLVLGREPQDSECLEFTQYAEQYGLANACRVLINLNEFIYVD